jgi:prophage regulatory protein
MKFFLNLDEVAASLSISRRGVQRLVQEGDFPKPRTITPRRIGWIPDEVKEWVKARPVADMLPPPVAQAPHPDE